MCHNNYYFQPNRNLLPSWRKSSPNLIEVHVPYRLPMGTWSGIGAFTTYDADREGVFIIATSSRRWVVKLSPSFPTSRKARWVNDQIEHPSSMAIVLPNLCTYLTYFLLSCHRVLNNPHLCLTYQASLIFIFIFILHCSLENLLCPMALKGCLQPRPGSRPKAL